jgi:3-isopropylmalate dehydratase small subunit
LDVVLHGNTLLAVSKVCPIHSFPKFTDICTTSAGVQAVIARPFSFIYGRNQSTLGLLVIIMSDEVFFSAATENSKVEIDVLGRKIRVAGMEFGFSLTEMEYKLMVNRGMNEAYKRFGGAIWEKMTRR